MKEIILASQSPRRSQLLAQAEIPFTVMVQPVQEHWPEDMPPEQAPEYIARNKALAVLNNLSENHPPVVAADTVVLLNGEIIGKPESREAAIATLLKLSGQTHRVITGVVIVYQGREISFRETTEVSFYELSEADAAFYTDKYQPYDKAGAYAIQEWIGVTCIRSINGDFYNVMGLPVSRLYRELSRL
ncbi:MAG: septum formation protein Maf [Dinghuibacter sp.]|nr:septum formation protein Maf [Dinghuibacter sp.]